MLSTGRQRRSLLTSGKSSFILFHKKRWLFVCWVSRALKTQDESTRGWCSLSGVARQHVPGRHSHTGFAVCSISVWARKARFWLASC